MATRAPLHSEVPTAKHIGGPLHEQRRPASEDDPFLKAVRSAPFDTEPMTKEEIAAFERYLQKKRSAQGQ